jgi:type IV secretion system protein VirB10
MCGKIVLFLTVAGAISQVHAQTAPLSDAPSGQEQGGFKPRGDVAPAAGRYRIEPGTHFLLNMINSVSTKQAAVGDAIYLETAFPILAENRIVVPQGSWVKGTITGVKRPGRLKGRGELQVRFDSLTLPNGVTRNFRSDLGAIDGRGEETLDHEHNKIQGAGNKKGDASTVAGTTITGAAAGAGIGAAAGNAARGAGIGAGAGAVAGLVGVLMSRGPDAMLTKGSTVEMVLDHQLAYAESDLNFSNAPARAVLSEGTGPQAKPAGGFGTRLPY